MVIGMFQGIENCVIAKAHVFQWGVDPQHIILLDILLVHLYIPRSYVAEPLM